MKTKILNVLRKSDGYVSGQALCNMLGVSRTAVWKVINQLKEEGIEVAVVSMPCTELFDNQPIDYQEEILGTAPRIAVEAASKFGWEKYVGLHGDIIGMDGFGASGPAEQLYEYFGITVDEVVDSVKNLIKK